MACSLRNLSPLPTSPLPLLLPSLVLKTHDKIRGTSTHTSPSLMMSHQQVPTRNPHPPTVVAPNKAIVRVVVMVPVAATIERALKSGETW